MSHRLYELNDMRTDLSPLITLARYFDRLMREVDEKFKELFISSETWPMHVNPYFLIAWQVG